MVTRVKELHKYALECDMCEHGWAVTLSNPTSAEMMAAISDNKYCPQCGGIEVLYVGENISVRSR